jgi:hypothetical protein
MVRKVGLVLTLFVTSFLFADARVTQKTQVQFGGALGGVVNVFGGKAAREGITSDVSVKKNRRSSQSGDAGEIVDLDEEKVYTLDYARKTYKVTTFAEMRKQFEDAMKNAEKESKPSDSDKRDPNAKEYEVDFDVKATGERETINGFDAKQTIATVTIREKGKKLSEAGGSVLTADMWLTPRIAAMREVEEFERRYLKQLWGEVGMDIRAMAALMATAPQMSKAMKKLQEKQGALDGSSVRTTLTYESVPDPRVRAEEAEEASPGDAAVKALGGLMGRMRKKPAEDSEKASPSKSAAPKTPSGRTLFTSTTEVLAAGATGADVAIPAGFTQRK